MNVEQMLGQLLRDGYYVTLTGRGAGELQAWHLQIVGDAQHNYAVRVYKGYDLYSVVRAARDGAPEGMVS